MGKFFRIRCPICGSLPHPHQIDTTEQTREPVVRIILTTMGGKVAAGEGEEYKKKKKGGAKGSITYEDVTDQHPEMVEEFTERFAKRAVLFAKKSGLLKEEE